MWVQHAYICSRRCQQRLVFKTHADDTCPLIIEVDTLLSMLAFTRDGVFIGCVFVRRVTLMQQCTSRRGRQCQKRGLRSHCWMHPSMKSSYKFAYPHFLSMSPGFDNNCCIVVSPDSSCWPTKTLCSALCTPRHLLYIHLLHLEPRPAHRFVLNALFFSYISAVTSFPFQSPAPSTSHLSNTQYGLGTQERGTGSSPTTAAAQPGAKRSRNATSE